MPASGREASSRNRLIRWSSRSSETVSNPAIHCGSSRGRAPTTACRRSCPCTSAARRQFSVVLERTVRELNGIPCLDHAAELRASRAPEIIANFTRNTSSLVIM
ncbi:hypothetical protein FKD06_19470 [Serratia sp. SRS-8-S-2018]|nr:hypothetical protein FKD06_19470 [Serratia sp. SRS-8-S-2018]